MKVGFYTHIKEYFKNLNWRPLLVITVLFCLLWTNGMAVALSQVIKERGISLKITAVSIPEALSTLEEKAGCSINYNKSIFNINSKVSIEVKNMELAQVLQKMLAGTRVTFKFADQQTILLYKLPDPLKPGRISGKILDEKGETLPGATIRVIENGTGTQASVDGAYILNINPGTYTLEISYLSYQTQRITGVTVTEGKNTPLDISMKPTNSSLNEVVITASYRKASVEGLLARQKNASEISNGISAEQIARTPDRNIGESLKRISGVSTIDNKFVIVRGIGERYNSAMLDGVILPSTEAQTRNFSFDLIPSNLVDNVVVSKTVTPDMNASFGGGLIQINTKDIPNENFLSFTAGTSYNDQSTGKDFLSHKRGKYDYFGFDDGRRYYPEGLQHTSLTTEPNTGLTDAEYQKKVDDQSKRFKNDNFTLYKYKAAPSQNYQFTIGQLYSLDTTGKNKLGFTSALSYRNIQSINQFDQQRRGDWNFNANNTGASYDFNTTLGALLNVGLQLGNNRFSFRNTYTHLYDNTLVRTIGYDSNNGTDDITKGLLANRIQEVDDPTFTDLLQNKLGGQHQLGKVKIEWNAARTSIDRKEKDLSIATQRPLQVGNDYQYFYYTSRVGDPQINPTSRHNYHNQEKNYSWNIDAIVPLSVAKINNSVKAGYFGVLKKATFDWQIASLVSSGQLADSLNYIPISEMINPANFGANGYNYLITPYFLDAYEGKSITQAGYLMLDSRLMEKLRLVWGIRAEYYKYTEIKNGSNVPGTEFKLPADKAWQWLPSANLTYSPTSRINIRAAVSSSVIRPELMDNSQFFKYNPNLGALFGNQGLTSTRINSYDIKTEWFPGAGEIISAGAFYKKFDKPTELTFILVNGNINYYLQNADQAQVYGLEFEARKNFGFISQNKFLRNLTVYSNLTLQKSNVVASYRIVNPDTEVGGNITVNVKQKRTMYGQSPYLINVGLQYTGNHFGFNVLYNKSGYKTYIVSSLLDQIEYEKPREQIDAQISYKFFQNKFEIKVNAANLLNSASTFFVNTGSYEANPDEKGDGDQSDAKRLKPGFTNKYEEGDQIRYRQKFGRTYSTSLTYNF